MFHFTDGLARRTYSPTETNLLADDHVAEIGDLDKGGQVRTLPLLTDVPDGRTIAVRDLGSLADRLPITIAARPGETIVGFGAAYVIRDRGAVVGFQKTIAGWKVIVQDPDIIVDAVGRADPGQAIAVGRVRLCAGEVTLSAALGTGTRALATLEVVEERSRSVLGTLASAPYGIVVAPATVPGTATYDLVLKSTTVAARCWFFRMQRS